MTILGTRTLRIDQKTYVNTLSLPGLLNNQAYLFGRKDRQEDDGLHTIRVVIEGSHAISREHCKITQHDDRYWIADLGSQNGTHVNSRQLSAHVEEELKLGDKITMDHRCQLVFTGPIEP